MKTKTAVLISKRIVQGIPLAAAVAVSAFSAEATTIYGDCKSASPVSPYADKASAAFNITSADAVVSGLTISGTEINMEMYKGIRPKCDVKTVEIAPHTVQTVTVPIRRRKK